MLQKFYNVVSILYSVNNLSVCLQIMIEWLKLDPRTHTYSESVSPEERHEHVYMTISLLCKKKTNKKTKRVLWPENRMELDPQIHIDLGSVSAGGCHEHVYMATPLAVFFFIFKAKNCTFARK